MNFQMFLVLLKYFFHKDFIMLKEQENVIKHPDLFVKQDFNNIRLNWMQLDESLFCLKSMCI